jgi:hypothetical protein
MQTHCEHLHWFPFVHLYELRICYVVLRLMSCNGLKRPILDKKFRSRDFCVEGSFALHAEKQF